MKASKKRTKFWYIQGWGTYSNQTAVFVGYTTKEITRIMKRAKLAPDAVKEWEAGNADNFFSVESGNTGGMWFSKKGGYSVMWMPHFVDDWKTYETLIHECSHATLNILAQKNMIRTTHDGEIFFEDEAIAYQQEYLFREIRRKLQRAFKI